MTRRAEAEAMLARYGENAFCGGGCFRAVIRPDGFSAPGEDAAGGLRYDYFGPAAHKLPVGGTVRSGGESYTVCRCETVRLVGEELYVRAVLAAAVPPENTGATLERDGKIFARAYSCSAEAAQDAEAVIPVGESAPAEIAAGSVVWKLTLAGVRAESGESLFPAGEFRVTSRGADGTAVYTGCRWTRVKSGEGQGGCGAMSVLAAGREAAGDG